MTVTLADICHELHNYDFNKRPSKYSGTFVVSGKEIDLSGLVADGSVQLDQYIRVLGSVFNDGVYKYGTDKLAHDEVFEGEVWALNIPPEVVGLVSEINTWLASDDAKNLSSPYASESFGGYSYSIKGSMSQSDSEAGAGAWKAQFKNKLNRWRKMP